jgi:hypothetical protein
MRRRLVAGALAVLVAALPARADGDGPDARPSSGLDPAFRGAGSLSDAGPKRRPRLASLFVGWPGVYWGYGGVPLSVGGRYLQPVLHDGFAPQLNDSFSIEAGVDLFALGRSAFGFALSVPVEAMWALHVTSRFTGYLKLGVSVDFRFGDWCWQGRCASVWPEFIGNLGLMYAVSDALVVRVELGYPGLKLGLGLPL